MQLLQWCIAWLPVLSCLLLTFCTAAVHCCVFGRRRTEVIKAPPKHIRTIEAMGCFADNPNDHDLPDFAGRYQKMRKQLCNSLCMQRETIFFAMGDGDACYCGNSHGRFGRTTEMHCPLKCVGDSGEACGGREFISVYKVVNGVPTVEH